MGGPALGRVAVCWVGSSSDLIRGQTTLYKDVGGLVGTDGWLAGTDTRSVKQIINTISAYSLYRAFPRRFLLLIPSPSNDDDNDDDAD